MQIQNSTLADIRSFTLKNGECVPTLEEYLSQGEQSKDCVLVLEIKRNDEIGREIIVVNKCISLLFKHNLLYPERVVFISKYYANPQWIEEAHELGMIVNVWTVDKEEDIRRLIDLGVDQITTNTPALVKTILAEQTDEYVLS